MNAATEAAAAVRRFGPEDLVRAEQRNGCWYFLTSDARTMIPATHIGADRAAHVSVHRPRANQPGWVAWRMHDRCTGEIFLSGKEIFWPHGPMSFGYAARRALRWVRGYGCTTRVRPGERYRADAEVAS